MAQLVRVQAGQICLLAAAPSILYSLIPGCCGASREQPREYWGSGPVRSGCLRRSGPSATRDRSAGGHGKAGDVGEENGWSTSAHGYEI